MNVHVLYFSAFREQRGMSDELIQTDSATAGELYDELRRRHGLSLKATVVRAAVNRALTDMTAPLRDGDEVAFVPPTAFGPVGAPCRWCTP